MKSLFLIRHAKSDWDEPQLTDHERGLNKRGKRDAPRMAQLFAQMGIYRPWLCSSTAVRARRTATYFAQALGMEETEIETDARLYLHEPHPDADAQLWAVIRALPESASHACLFGHNPTFTDFINHHSNGYLENLPTCAIAILTSAEASWADAGRSPLHFVGVLSPAGLE